MMRELIFPPAPEKIQEESQSEIFHRPFSVVQCYLDVESNLEGGPTGPDYIKWLKTEWSRLVQIARSRRFQNSFEDADEKFKETGSPREVDLNAAFSDDGNIQLITLTQITPRLRVGVSLYAGSGIYRGELKSLIAESRSFWPDEEAVSNSSGLTTATHHELSLSVTGIGLNVDHSMVEHRKHTMDGTFR